MNKNNNKIQGQQKKKNDSGHDVVLVAVLVHAHYNINQGRLRMKPLIRRRRVALGQVVWLCHDPKKGADESVENTIFQKKKKRIK
jgi:hypothetical protein